MASTVDIIVNAQTGQAESALSGISSTLGSLAGVAGGVLVAGVAAATAAFAALGAAVAVAVSQAAQAELQQASLVALLNSTHAAAGMTQEAVNALASQFRDLAGGTDDAVVAIEMIGLRSGAISSEQMPQFIKATLDLGTVMGNTSTAATLLARAQDDPVGAFTRLERTTGVYDLALKANIATMVKHNDTAGAVAAILNFVAQTTGGAAAAAADTLSGKWSILTGHAQDFAETIGNHLLPIIEHLLDVAIPALDGLYNAFEGTIVPLIDQASAWGEGIINALASGMAVGAQAVVSVINQIGAIIADLMMPGSPPKFLPLLDVWGREAVDVYLAGWTTFDKSVFDEIGTAIKAGLDSQTIQEYADTMHKLADANDAVASAQLNLNNVTSVFDAQLSPLQAKLAAVTNQQQQAADRAKIAALTADMNASGTSPAQKAADALEIQRLQLQDQIANITLEKNTAVSAAKEKLTLAQEHQKVLADAAKELKNQIDIQAEMTKAISQGSAAVGGMHGAVSALHQALAGLGGGGAFTPLTSAMNQLKSDVALNADAIKANIQGFIVDIQSAVAKVANFAKPITDALAFAWQMFSQTLPAMKMLWNDMLLFIKQQIDIMSPQISQDLQSMVTDIARIIEGLALLWNQNFWLISGVTATTMQLIIAVVAASMTAILGAITVALDLVSFNFKQAQKDINGTFVTFFNQLLSLFDTNLKALVANVLIKFFDIELSIQTKVLEIIAWLQVMVPAFVSIGGSIIDGIKQGVMNKVGALIASVVDAIRGAIAAAHDALDSHSPSRVFADIGANMMQGMAIGISGNAHLPANATAGAVTNITNNNIVNASYGGSPAPNAVAREMRLISKLNR